MWQDHFYVPTQHGLPKKKHFPVHGVQTGQVACLCTHGDATAQTACHVIMLLARLEQMKLN